MGSIYAFMAGVNDYPPSVATPLAGCVNDITEARRLLEERTGGAVAVRTVLNREATVAAVKDGIRTFLGTAAPGDTALFWFSGHGTEQLATGTDLLIEATGRTQALVCADGPLSDKRLGALLDEVAGRGVQVVAVLDCCFSGGASREANLGLTARYAPPRPEWRVGVGGERDGAPAGEDTRGSAQGATPAGGERDGAPAEEDTRGSAQGATSAGGERVGAPGGTYAAESGRNATPDMPDTARPNPDTAGVERGTAPAGTHQIGSGQDTTPAMPDTVQPDPDTARAGRDAAPAGTQARGPARDAMPARADATRPNPDTGVIERGTAPAGTHQIGSGRDATPGMPDTVQPGPDTAEAGRDAAAVGAGAVGGGRDAILPGPDAASPGRDVLRFGCGAVPGDPDVAWSSRDASPVGAGAGPARHLLLAASRLDQLSYEGYFEGRRHGVFTHALLGAVRAAGAGVTYREVLAAADARVRRNGGRQQPVLFPEGPGGADLPFLAGAAAGVGGEYLLRCGPQGWEVDCGTGHGLRDGEGTEFGVVGEGAVVRARVVRAARVLVEPVGWEPDPERVYPVALTALASAPATVSVEGPGESLRAAVASYGPGGRPAPLVRVVDSDSPEEYGDLHFRVVVSGGFAQVLGRDGTPFVEPLPTPDADARGVVRCLTHLARWHRLRDLTARPSVLDNQVQIEIVPWHHPDGPPLLPDGRGEIVCAYGPDQEPPLVSVRLHNRSQRPLWCTLIDLTDRYAASTELYPGHFIGPGRTGYALDGEPVQLSLPANRRVEAGAEARDWFKLVVAEGELNTLPFQMPAWDPGVGTEDTDGVLRLGAPDRPSSRRDAGRVTHGSPGPGRWTTRTLAVRTVVPLNNPPQGASWT